MQSRKKSGESPVQEESRSLCFVEVEVSNIGNIDIGVVSKVNVEHIDSVSRHHPGQDHAVVPRPVLCRHHDPEVVAAGVREAPLLPDVARPLGVEPGHVPRQLGPLVPGMRTQPDIVEAFNVSHL